MASAHSNDSAEEVMRRQREERVRAVSLGSSRSAVRLAHGLPAAFHGGAEVDEGRVGDAHESACRPHEAARIAALAEGGEIVASRATVGDGSPYPQTEPRTVALRGISEPMEIVSIDWR